MHLPEIGRRENAELEVPEVPCDCERACAGHECLVQLAEQVVDERHESADPASCRRSSVRRTSSSWVNTGRRSIRMSKACSRVDWLCGITSRTARACSNQPRASRSAE